MIASLRAVLVLGCGSFPLDAFAADPPKKLWTEKVVAKPLDPDAPVSMRAFSTLARELSPAVVNLFVDKGGAGLAPSIDSLGTGFVIHQDGYALTNYHVVADASAILVKTIADEVFAARVVGYYEQIDVALLKIEAPRPLVVAPLGDSDVLQIGEWVIAIGNPFGLGHTVTAGIVSAKGRRDVNSQVVHTSFIQTDASINPGNSGGPLINIRGEVIGINTAINAAGQGIGFAVPINRVKAIAGRLAGGQIKRSFLGVRIGPVTAEVERSHGYPSGLGALVVEVVAGGPADQAGILPGDVITHWDEEALEHWEDLPWLASASGTERPVSLRVLRPKRSFTVKVALSDHPGQTGQALPTPAAKGQPSHVER
jgi:S1-C subfamily serine protease